MTITELIRELKHIEADHGDMEVEANNDDGDLSQIKKLVIEPIRQTKNGPIKRVVVVKT